MHTVDLYIPLVIRTISSNIDTNCTIERSDTHVHTSCVSVIVRDTSHSVSFRVHLYLVGTTIPKGCGLRYIVSRVADRVIIMVTTA